ncbi:head-tail connector protein [Enterobacter asburiae]|uniref:head-tail connector protein n=1 Tax=Enterobacter asburiae TaxID=61645 RepID=UPI00192BBF17|nr:head-tail connector protein [Enterobacter asburiae]MBL5911232.1 phage gp6-like head-tail connector protein [Enterobacter asburiae]
MIRLVTVEQVKKHLNIDDDYYDDDLDLKIMAASAALLAYMQGGRQLVVDESGNLIEGETLSRVQVAALVLVGWLDRNRGGEENDRITQGELPFSITMLIYDLRRPTII